MGALSFCRVLDDHGKTLGIEIVGAWEDDIVISPLLLQSADRRFITHGDGLVTFSCLNGSATYGVVGEDPAIDYPGGRFLHARLLHAQPNEGAG